MKGTEDVDQAALFALIERDPLQAAKICQARILADQGGVHEQRRHRLAEGYGIAEQLKKDYKLWRQFIADPFFDKDQRIRKLNDDRFQYIVTRAVMIFLFCVPKLNKSMRNRVWRYARALNYYSNQGVSVEELVGRIKKDGGIEKVCRLVSKDFDLEDEKKDWALEMRSRMAHDEQIKLDQLEAEIKANKLAELPPEDYGEPAAWLILDDEQKKMIRASDCENKLVLIVEKLDVDDDGKFVLNVDSVEGLDTWGLDGRRAMLMYSSDGDDCDDADEDEEEIESGLENIAQCPSTSVRPRITGGMTEDRHQKASKNRFNTVKTVQVRAVENSPRLKTVQIKKGQRRR